MTRRGGSVSFVIVVLVLIAACSAGSSGESRGVPCAQTVAQYCAGRGASASCAPTWTEAAAACTLITSLYACSDKNAYLNGSSNAYYDATSGALVAIGGDGTCLAGPAQFVFPVCAQGSYITCPRCAEPCDCLAPGAHSACCPADVATFAPAWTPPTAFHQALCTDAQTALLVDCFNDLPSPAACAAFAADPSNAACLACAVTRSTARTYGPIVQGSADFEINEPGCIALAAGDVTATGCGAKVSAKAQCVRRSCEPSCPLFVDDAASLASLLRCEALAATRGCKTYADAASCALAVEGDAGPGAICAQTGATFRENAKAMVTLFCGGAARDGGVTDSGEGG